MYRSSPRSWTLTLTGALAVFVLLSITRAQTAAAQNVNQEAAMHYSLYYENFKNENYKDALPDLVWILENAPGFPKNRDTNFERAVQTYAALSERAESTEDKRMYLDSALVMFDRAVPTIKGLDGEIDEFEWTRNKGRFIQEHLDLLDDMKSEAIQTYHKAYELDPKRIDPYYLDVIISDYYTTGNIGAALDFLRELKESRGEEPGVQDLIRKYFAVIPPEEQIAFLEEEVEKNPDNVEAITQLFDLYKQEGLHDKMMSLAPRMREMEPTPDILRLLTRMYIEDGEYEEAEAVFKELETKLGGKLTAQDYHNMGIAQMEQERFGAAQSYYRKALEADPEYKAALKAIADLYATAVSSCGVSDRETKGVFWLVADAYQRAGDNAGYARYRAVFPNAEDIFYTSKWTEGSQTSVSYSCRGLTISGTTTVRKNS